MITDEVMQAATILERLKNGEIEASAKVIRDLDKAVRAILANYDDWPTSLTGMLGDLRKAQAKVWDKYIDQLENNLENLSTDEADIASGIIRTQAARIGLKVALRRPKALKKAVLTRPITGTGELLKPFVENLSSSAIKRVEKEVMISWGMGRTLRETITAVRGTKAAGYADGIWATTQNDAKTVIRTAYQHVSSVAFQESLLSSDLDMYQLVATLDSRTSKICRSLDLTTYQTGKGPVPPLHPNCRTRMVPYWGKDEESTATRSSATGYVPQDESYYDWLKKQSAEYQDDALGKTWGKLFRDGGVAPEEFSKRVINNLQPLTLSELRTKYPEMFNNANV